MKFGTSTRIVIQDQRIKAVEPRLKMMIMGAAQNAVANFQFIIADGDYDTGTAQVTFDDVLSEAPVYAALKGKGAGKSSTSLLYETAKVHSEKTAYEYQQEAAISMSAAASVSPAMELTDVPVILATDGMQIHRNALLTPLYMFYAGSPIRITNDGVDSALTGLPADARSAMTGKNVVAMYHDSSDDSIAYQIFTDNGLGGWVAEGVTLESSYVSILEDQFNTMGTNVAHGTVYIDYVYNDYALAGRAAYEDTSPAGKMYYVEDLDGIRNIFGEDATKIAPSGAAYNAYQCYMANGGVEGFYVFAAAAAPGELYLTAEEIAIALSETTRFKDVYDVIPITYDPDMPQYLHAHLVAMLDPELRQERRGYAGLYMPQGPAPYYQYDEFVHMCEIGKDGERDYMIGLTEEAVPTPGTGRYGGRSAYVAAMMNRNVYTTNPKLTLCETKLGVIDGLYVTAATVMVVYVGYRHTFLPGYVMAETTLPLLSAVSFAGLLGDIDHLHPLQNYGILSVYQATSGAPVTIYYPCTAATDYRENSEEYLVVATDMLAREIRAMLRPHIARGEDNKTAPNFEGEKAQRYVKKLNTFVAPLVNRYVVMYEVFSSVELVSIANNPDYEGGVMIAIRVRYLYAVNHIEVIIYI